jgi:hypothetical protein
MVSACVNHDSSSIVSDGVDPSVAAVDEASSSSIEVSQSVKKILLLRLSGVLNCGWYEDISAVATTSGLETPGGGRSIQEVVVLSSSGISDEGALTRVSQEIRLS